jgi:hypothetical protein
MKTFTLSFLFVVASLFAGASSAQVSDADQAFSVLEQAIATFNARDYAAYEQLVADDFEAASGVSRIITSRRCSRPPRKLRLS